MGNRTARPSVRGRIEVPALWTGRVVLGIAVLFWLVLALTGGSSRADMPSLLLLRPVTVIALFLLLVLPGRVDWHPVRTPLLMLAAFAAIMILQLIPLPAALLRLLPGHAIFTQGLVIAGKGGGWGTISVTPDRTWNSLVALLVPATALVGYARLGERARAATLPAAIALAVASALLGMAQLAGGEDSPLYFYSNTHRGFPVGLLANRNHQAALLAVMLPAVAAWAFAGKGPGEGQGWVARPYRLATGAGLLATLTIATLVSWSRAGLVLLVIMLPVAALAWPRPRPRAMGGAGPRGGRWVPLAVTLVFIALLLGVTWLSGRATSVSRLMASGDVRTDGRFAFAPTVIVMIRASFPFGYGFGSFDPVFRHFEPDASLGTAYVNNAHDDLLELAATGGLPGLIVAAWVLIWIGRRSVAAWRLPPGSRYPWAWAAVPMAWGLLLASLADYPLRTPLLGAVFATLMAWLADTATARSRSVDACLAGRSSVGLPAGKGRARFQYD